LRYKKRKTGRLYYTGSITLGITKIEHMRQVLQFMSIKQRLYCNVCIFIYKILNNLLPVALSNGIEIVENEERRANEIGRKYCIRVPEN